MFLYFSMCQVTFGFIGNSLMSPKSSLTRGPKWVSHRVKSSNFDHKLSLTRPRMQNKHIHVIFTQWPMSKEAAQNGVLQCFQALLLLWSYQCLDLVFASINLYRVCLIKHDTSQLFLILNQGSILQFHSDGILLSLLESLFKYQTNKPSFFLPYWKLSCQSSLNSFNEVFWTSK